MFDRQDFGRGIVPSWVLVHISSPIQLGFIQGNIKDINNISNLGEK